MKVKEEKNGSYAIRLELFDSSDFQNFIYPAAYFYAKRIYKEYIYTYIYIYIYIYIYTHTYTQRETGVMTIG